VARENFRVKFGAMRAYSTRARCREKEELFGILLIILKWFSPATLTMDSCRTGNYLLT